jgi:hypothetical protein
LLPVVVSLPFLERWCSGIARQTRVSYGRLHRSRTSASCET